VLADLKLRDGYDGLVYLAESTRNLPSLQSHHHRELELNFIVQGTITYVVDGNRLSFSPRTQLWIFPGKEHQLIIRSENARFYVVVFTPSLIDKACHIAKYQDLKQLPDDQGRLASAVLDPKRFDLISKMMASLMEGSLDSDLLNREAGFGPASDFRFEHHDPDALNAGLHYLLLLCWRFQIEATTSGEAVTLHPAVKRAIRIVSENDTGQSLDELSRACGASKSYLSRTFHRQIGVPLHQYRNSLLLARFFDADRGTDRSTIAEAVYAAGFGSYAQFYKVFTQSYGCGLRECFRSKPE
jgi:AraC-like DNA-binding protein